MRPDDEVLPSNLLGVAASCAVSRPGWRRWEDRSLRLQPHLGRTSAPISSFFIFITNIYSEAPTWSPWADASSYPSNAVSYRLGLLALTSTVALFSLSETIICERRYGIPHSGLNFSPFEKPCHFFLARYPFRTEK